MGMVTAGCGEWPRHSHIVDDDGAIPATSDLASLIEVDWISQQESPQAENDIPTDPDVRTEFLGQTQGHLFQGSLAGTGWSSTVPEPIESASCAGAIGKRTVQDVGDYQGDVDFLMIVSPEIDGTLCAEAAVLDMTSTNPEASVDINGFGWDLGLLEVDDCGIPMGGVPDALGELVGFNLGGAGGGWGVTVSSERRYAVFFAGYHPLDPDNLINYNVAISLVGSEASGAAGICPLLPEDV